MDCVSRLWCWLEYVCASALALVSDRVCLCVPYWSNNSCTRALALRWNLVCIRTPVAEYLVIHRLFRDQSDGACGNGEIHDSILPTDSTLFMEAQSGKPKKTELMQHSNCWSLDLILRRQRVLAEERFSNGFSYVSALRVMVGCSFVVQSV